MSREVLMLVDALAREKNVDREVVFEALEMAQGGNTEEHCFKIPIVGQITTNRYERIQLEQFLQWLVREDWAGGNTLPGPYFL